MCYSCYILTVYIYLCVYTTGLSIRRVLDAPIDPLLHHKQPLTSTSTTSISINPLASLFPATSSHTTATARVDLSPVRESTETSSSELSGGQKSKNNDPLPPSSKTAIPTTQSKLSSAFQIFEESHRTNYNNINNNTVSSVSSVSKPSDDSFITEKRGSSNLSAIPTLASKRPNPGSNPAINIFTDDNESHTLTGYSKSTHQVTKTPSISIFTDDDEDTYARAQSNTKHSTTRTASHTITAPHSTTTTTRGSAPVTQAQDGDNDDAQLQAYLNQLGVLDGEDGTINTRLARRDIDSMFCSPMSADRKDTVARGGGGASSMLNHDYDSDLTNVKYTRNNGSMNSPQLLHLPAYAGGSYPSSSAPAGHMGAPRLAFGGGDLSAIQEVCVYLI